MTIQRKMNDSALQGAMLFATLFGVYSVVVIALAATRAYASINTYFFVGTVVFATISLTLLYFLIPSIHAFARYLGPYGLAKFHVWRIPAALTFLYYGSEGWLPTIFTNLAGWGDMLAGVLAALVILIPRSVKTITAFHLIGFADFLIAVGSGVILNSVAQQSMSNIVLLPVALIPLIGVPLSGATHIAALHILRTDKANEL